MKLHALIVGICCLAAQRGFSEDLTLCSEPKSAMQWKGRAGAWMANVDSDAFDSREKLAAKIVALKEMGVTEIYPVVWNKGTLLFRAPELQARWGQSSFYKEQWKNRDILAEVVEEAKSHGMKVYAWFESGLKIPAGMDIQKKHPEWFLKNLAGGVSSVEGHVPLARLNPARPEVRQLYADMFRYVVDHYGVDGVQVDDHFSLSREWGYDAATLAQYRRDTGLTPPRSIPPINTPASSSLFVPWRPWMQWKANRVTELMGDIVTAVRTSKNMKFQISPHPHPWTVNVLAQDWTEWMKRGWVDEVIAQVYREGDSNYSFELRNPGFVGAKKCVPILIGVYAGQKNRIMPTEKVLWQIGIARDFAFEGVAFFNAETLFNGNESAEERTRKIGEALNAKP